MVALPILRWRDLALRDPRARDRPAARRAAGPRTLIPMTRVQHVERERTLAVGPVRPALGHRPHRGRWNTRSPRCTRGRGGRHARPHRAAGARAGCRLTPAVRRAACTSPRSCLAALGQRCARSLVGWSSSVLIGRRRAGRRGLGAGAGRWSACSWSRSWSATCAGVTRALLGSRAARFTSARGVMSPDDTLDPARRASRRSTPSRARSSGCSGCRRCTCRRRAAAARARSCCARVADGEARRRCGPAAGLRGPGRSSICPSGDCAPAPAAAWRR